ncbi:MAG TPA: hypothetical protein VH540_28580 [Ktedonobacterales bacterium]|jgi:hypothetical protein
MLKQQVIKLVIGLAVVLTLFGGVRLGLGAAHIHATATPAAQHFLADVDPFPPGH